MPYWQVHFLNARHALTGVMPEVRAAVSDAVARASAHAELPDFDVVVRAGEAGTDWGVASVAPAPGLIELTLTNGRFAPDLVVRRVVRELFHMIRWDYPGYGRSLGEALVSEGLAGHFVTQVLGGPADPWDATPPTPGLAKRAMTEWAWLDYDRALWFEGRGNIRKWAGYGLAHRLVADHLDRNEGADAVSLAHVAAEALRPAMRRLSGSEPAEAETVPAATVPEPVLAVEKTADTPGPADTDTIAHEDAEEVPGPRAP